MLMVLTSPVSLQTIPFAGNDDIRTKTADKVRCRRTYIYEIRNSVHRAGLDLEPAG